MQSSTVTSNSVEQKQFLKLLQLATEGQARSTLLTGQHGSGKTRFIFDHLSNQVQGAEFIHFYIRVGPMGLTLDKLLELIDEKIRGYATQKADVLLKAINAELGLYALKWDQEALMQTLALTQGKSVSAAQLQNVIQNQLTQGWPFLKKLMNKPKTVAEKIAFELSQPQSQLIYQCLDPLQGIGATKTLDTFKAFEQKVNWLQSLAKAQSQPTAIIISIDQWERVASDANTVEEIKKFKEAMVKLLKAQALQRDNFVMFVLACQSEQESIALSDGLYSQLKQKLLLTLDSPVKNLTQSNLDENLRAVVSQNQSQLLELIPQLPKQVEEIQQILGGSTFEQIKAFFNPMGQQQWVESAYLYQALLESPKSQLVVEATKQTYWIEDLHLEHLDNVLPSLTLDSAIPIGQQIANTPEIFEAAKVKLNSRCKALFAIISKEELFETSAAWLHWLAYSQLDAQEALELLIDQLQVIPTELIASVLKQLNAYWSLESSTQLPYPEVIWQKLKPILEDNQHQYLLLGLPLLTKLGLKSQQLELAIEPYFAIQNNKGIQLELLRLCQLLPFISSGIERQLLALIAFESEPEILELAFTQLKRLPNEKQIPVMRELTKHPNSSTRLSALIVLSQLDNSEALSTWVEPLLNDKDVDEEIEKSLILFLSKNPNQQAQHLLLEYIDETRKPWMLWQAIQGLAQNTKSKKAIEKLNQLKTKYPSNTLVGASVDHAIITLTARLGKDELDRVVYQPEADNIIIDLVERPLSQ